MSVKRIISRAILGSCMLISACQAKPPGVGVGVHAVNYTEDEITYVIADPLDKENSAGGESINPFEAGGLMCCYTVPAKWRPGIKVELQVEVWLTSQPDGPDGNPKIEKKKVSLVLPKPLEDKPSELWVIRNPDGRFDLVASNYGPAHPKWPGKIKGMPTVSVSYLQKLIKRDLAQHEDYLKVYRGEQQALSADPAQFAKKRWEFDLKHRRDRVVNVFSGPTDRKYIVFLKADTNEMVERTEKKIAALRRELQ